MELWIRSQDKNLLSKIDTLRIGVNDIFTKDDLVNIWGNDIFALGGYKSKERALEVLNEIQNVLNAYNRAEGKSGNYEDLDLTIKVNMLSYVYEMPEK